MWKWVLLVFYHNKVTITITKRASFSKRPKVTWSFLGIECIRGNEKGHTAVLKPIITLQMGAQSKKHTLCSHLGFTLERFFGFKGYFSTARQCYRCGWLGNAREFFHQWTLWGINKNAAPSQKFFFQSPWISVTLGETSRGVKSYLDEGKVWCPYVLLNMTSSLQ